MSDVSGDQDDGFTLVELLVALALIAILSVYCLDSLRRLQDIRRIEASVAQTEGRDAGRAFLRKTISGARISSALSAAGTPSGSLRGNSQSLTFINTLDDRLVRGGLYELTFSFDNDSGTLSLDRAPVGQDSTPAVGEPSIILNELADASFQYFGKATEVDNASWHTAWQSSWLPQALKIEVQFKGVNSEKRESLIVPLMTAN
jgi:prepilin-type N-terminal cleavage/methylation domain-containing protein